jgi:peptidyl-prolyl cis-trans isomerase C
MLQDAYEDKTQDQIAREFGPDFAHAIFDLQPRSWTGPIQSGYGWHVIRIDSLVPSVAPAFEEVAPQVKDAWLDQQRKALKAKALDEMRARYKVVSPLDQSEKPILSSDPAPASRSP